MTEEKLSSDIVLAVRNKHPDTRGRFFHISNERNSTKQAWKAKSIGIYSGVSDFIYIYNGNTTIINPEGFLGFIALEIKVPNSRHKVEHIEQQVGWGELVESLGGCWRLITSVEEAVSCIEGNLKGYTTKEVRELLKENKLKNIIIPLWQSKF